MPVLVPASTPSLARPTLRSMLHSITDLKITPHPWVFTENTLPSPNKRCGQSRARFLLNSPILVPAEIVLQHVQQDMVTLIIVIRRTIIIIIALTLLIIARIVT